MGTLNLNRLTPHPKPYPKFFAMLYPPHRPRSVHTESNTHFPSAAHRWKWIAGVTILLTTALLCVFHPGSTGRKHRQLMNASQLMSKLRRLLEPYTKRDKTLPVIIHDGDLPDGISPGSHSLANLLGNLEKNRDGSPHEQLLRRLIWEIQLGKLRSYMQVYATRAKTRNKGEVPLIKQMINGHFLQGCFYASDRHYGKGTMTTIDDDLLRKLSVEHHGEHHPDDFDGSYSALTNHLVNPVRMQMRELGIDVP